MSWTAAGELKEGMDTLDAGVADATHSVVAAAAEEWYDVASAARDVADATNSVAAATNSAAVKGQAVSVSPTQMSLASERVAAEIVACSDKEEDEEAFWSDLSLSQSEAQHSDSQGQFRNEVERDVGTHEKWMRARMLLQVAEECRKEADAARQKLVAP